MSTTKSFALLGFLPDAELKLKTLIQQHLESSVEWVTATDTKLQGVVINADFISSPQIQNYIRRTQANIVCCYNDNDGQNLAESSSVTGLHLKKHTATELQVWLSGLTGESVVKPNTSGIVEPTVSASQPAVNEKQDLKTPEPDFTSDADDDNYTQPLSLSKDYKELLSQLSKGNGYYIVKYRDNSIWLNPQKNEAYLDFERDKIQGIEKAKWATLSQFSPPRKTRRLQVDLWLFETLWQSSVSFAEHVPENGLFKLTRWPRPLCADGRSEALRLAAFIQSAAATTSLLSGKTGYDNAMVRRFVYAGLQSGQILQTGTASANDIAREHASSNVDESKLSLIRRIRSKLGL